jgi:hypothetical protein
MPDVSEIDNSGISSEPIDIALAIDIGGSKMAVGLVNRRGDMLHTLTICLKSWQCSLSVNSREQKNDTVARSLLSELGQLDLLKPIVRPFRL